MNLQVSCHLFRCSSSPGGLRERTEKETEGLRIRFLHLLSWNLQDNILKSKGLLCSSGVGKFFSAKVMSSLVWAARTKYHRLVACRQQRFICHGFEGRKSRAGCQHGERKEGSLQGGKCLLLSNLTERAAELSGTSLIRELGFQHGVFEETQTFRP